MSIRKNFIGFASAYSHRLSLDFLARITGQQFIIPFYHIVSDEDCLHVKHLYSYKGVKAFERDIDYLAKEYEPIAATDLPAVLAGKYKGKKIMLLTFDDGLREMSEIVAPILLRKGIPAIFFLNTDYIDNRGLMFRYKVSLLIDTYLKKGIDKTPLLNIRSIAELEKEKSLVDFNAYLRSHRPYMTSLQIISLITQGFAVGSHSKSHPYYEDIGIEKQLSETLDSLAILKRDFGIEQKLFAFPFTDYGVSKEFFEQIFAGGQVDFSFGGAGIKRDIHARQLQRVPMEGWQADAEQILKSEYLYYLMRMPLFKNTISRV